MPAPAQPNRSLLDGIEVLLRLAQAGEPVGVRALARDLGMEPTRAQRFLATLAHGGLAARVDDGRYQVGPGIHALGALALGASGLAGRALEAVPQLHDLGLTVALGVLWRGTIAYWYLGDEGVPMTEALGRAAGYPAGRSAIGLVLLAELSSEQVLAEVGAEEATTLAPALTQARERGAAVVRRAADDASLAVPVGAPAIAGLAISGAVAAADETALIDRLRPVAAQIAGS